MLRRIGLIFIFFGVMSAACASEAIPKTPDGCDLGCMYRCGATKDTTLDGCMYMCGC